MGNGNRETTFENEEHDLYVCNMLYLMKRVPKINKILDIFVSLGDEMFIQNFRCNQSS